MPKAIIKTKRFTLRPVRMSDAEDVARNINNRQIARNLAVVPHPYSLKDAKDWLGRTTKEWRRRRPKDLVFAIEISGEMVGAIGLHKIHIGHKATIGYWLGKAYWGQGIMTIATKKMINYSFSEFKLKRIDAHVYSYNPASMRVLEKSGFVLEGVLKKHTKKGNRYIDDYLYAKVR